MQKVKQENPEWWLYILNNDVQSDEHQQLHIALVKDAFTHSVVLGLSSLGN